MRGAGTLKGWQVDRLSGEVLLTFALRGVHEEDIKPLLNVPLDIKAETESKLKTNNQIAYCWKLMSMLAQKNRTTAEEVYGRFLQEDPHLYEDENGQHDIRLMKKGIIPVVRNHIHWFYLGTFIIRNPDPNIKTAIEKDAYAQMLGISKFNRQQMARFIDNVVYECKEAGIETLPSHEIENMKRTWGE